MGTGINKRKMLLRSKMKKDTSTKLNKKDSTNRREISTRFIKMVRREKILRMIKKRCCSKNRANIFRFKS